MEKRILRDIINKKTVELKKGTDRILLIPVIKNCQYKYIYKMYKEFEDGDGIIRYRAVEIEKDLIIRKRYIEREIASVEIQNGVLTGINSLINKWIKEGYVLWEIRKI